MRKILVGTAAAAGVLALAACGGGSSGTGAAGSGTSNAAGGSSSGGSSSATAADLTTEQSPFGPIIVTGSGRTVYVFDKDTPGSGTSACAGSCASLWPAVTTTAATPSASGVSGALGTLTRSDGTKQVTVDGHPVYTYSGDSGSGQTSGQGFMNLWWVVSPSGAKITAAAGASTPSSSSSQSSSAPAGGGATY